MVQCHWKFIRMYFVGSKYTRFSRYICQLNVVPRTYNTATRLDVPGDIAVRSSRFGLQLVPLKMNIQCRRPPPPPTSSSQLEVLHAGRVLSPVCRWFGATSAIGELGKAICLAASVVRLRHQQNRVEVQWLPGPGYRLRIVDETAVHFTWNPPKISDDKPRYRSAVSRGSIQLESSFWIFNLLAVLTY